MANDDLLKRGIKRFDEEGNEIPVTGATRSGPIPAPGTTMPSVEPNKDTLFGYLPGTTTRSGPIPPAGQISSARPEGELENRILSESVVAPPQPPAEEIRTARPEIRVNNPLETAGQLYQHAPNIIERRNPGWNPPVAGTDTTYRFNDRGYMVRNEVPTAPKPPLPNPVLDAANARAAAPPANIETPAAPAAPATPAQPAASAITPAVSPQNENVFQTRAMTNADIDRFRGTYDRLQGAERAPSAPGMQVINGTSQRQVTFGNTPSVRITDLGVGKEEKMYEGQQKLDEANIGFSRELEKQRLANQGHLQAAEKTGEAHVEAAKIAASAKPTDQYATVMRKKEGVEGGEEPYTFSKFTGEEKISPASLMQRHVNTLEAHTDPAKAAKYFASLPDDAKRQVAATMSTKSFGPMFEIYKKLYGGTK